MVAVGLAPRDRSTTLFWVLADFVRSVQPGATDGMAFNGGDHVIEGEAGRPGAWSTAKSWKA
jgi:hypothetical protein